MEDNLEIKILSTKRFIAELEDRLKHQQNWSNGELAIFQAKIKTSKEKLASLYQERDAQEFNT